MNIYSWSSRFSCLFLLIHRRPLGSEFIHSHCTPTWVLKILKFLIELWIPHLQPSGSIGFMKMDTILVYIWFWDVDPLCISRGYTLYSYMTWICNVFDWHPWFISSWAWVCPPCRDNCYFAYGTSRTLVPGSLDFVHWWRYCNVFWPSDDLMTSHIRGHLL